MSHSQITKRVGVVSFFTILSRITGLFRDMAIAYGFGTKMVADAFFVAFRLPNLLRRLFAEGALTVAFVPIFSESLRRSPDEARQVSNATWSLMTAILCVVSGLGILLSPLLVRLTAWGFTADPEKFQLTIFLTRVMFPYILLVSLAALAMGVLNSLKHFAVPASSSIFMNLGVIVGALGIVHLFDPPVTGLAVGVLLGGVLQLVVHFPVMRRFGFLPRLSWNPHHPGVMKIVRMMGPASFGAAVYQFNVIITTLLASFLPEGSVSYLWYADRIMEFPLGIWGVALATVLLPSLSDHAADRDDRALKDTFQYGLRMVFFLTLPAAGGLLVLGRPIVQLLFEHGTFTATSTLHTTQALTFFAIGLPFISAVRVTTNAFYSLQDARTPVRIAIASMAINLILSLILMGPLRHNGLALAISLSSVFNFSLQLWYFRKKVGPLGLRKIIRGLLKTSASTAIMMLILFILYLEIVPFVLDLSAMFLVFGLIVLGVVLFFGIEWLLGGEEIREILQVVRRRRG
ncbi:MAG: murein biosynthesis integral membrane protein MurJ [Deltaproteobacteria bacterium]|nr:murein biosynthesis integral membrane protein MurJ [Deltaproteobacteria bacterium]